MTTPARAWSRSRRIPGIVLRATTRYAFVIDKTFAPGVDVPEQFAELAAKTSSNAKATQLYAPLWPALDSSARPTVSWSRPCSRPATRSRCCSSAPRRCAPSPRHDRQPARRSDRRRRARRLLRAARARSRSRSSRPARRRSITTACSSTTRPASPMQQGMMTVPLTITIPNGPMPANGWPLWQFFHGSGGASSGPRRRWPEPHGR